MNPGDAGGVLRRGGQRRALGSGDPSAIARSSTPPSTASRASIWSGRPGPGGYRSGQGTLGRQASQAGGRDVGCGGVTSARAAGGGSVRSGAGASLPRRCGPSCQRLVLFAPLAASGRTKSAGPGRPPHCIPTMAAGSRSNQARRGQPYRGTRRVDELPGNPRSRSPLLRGDQPVISGGVRPAHHELRAGNGARGRVREPAQKVGGTARPLFAPVRLDPMFRSTTPSARKSSPPGASGLNGRSVQRASFSPGEKSTVWPSALVCEARRLRPRRAQGHRLAGEVGAVVVIFDEDPEVLSVSTTWLGEHRMNDMASTPLFRSSSGGTRRRGVRRVPDDAPPRP